MKKAGVMPTGGALEGERGKKVFNTTMKAQKALIVLSGGLDSSVLAYYVNDIISKNEGSQIGFITFDYGQRHKKEIQRAEGIAYLLKGSFHKIIDLSAMKHIFQGSSLIEGISSGQEEPEIPEGHYQEESMKETIVPGRNAIMCSIAWAFASSIGCNLLAFGAQAGDNFIYPDCRPAFFSALTQALIMGTGEDQRSTGLDLYTPFINYNKTKIVEIGNKLGVPMGRTWTCYKGGKLHCGKCGACVERKEAFAKARFKDSKGKEHPVIDATKYEV